MSERERLRIEYLHRVIGALDQYIEAGGVLHIHADPADLDRLEITFTLDAPDIYHALSEGHSVPPPPPEQPSAA